jgi:hypothetical protein
MDTSRMLGGLVWCDEHNCPLIRIGNSYECLIERVDAHIGGKRVRDIVPSSPKTPLTLVFDDGHTLPLLCPDCGGALHVTAEEEDELLEQIGGLYVIGVGYVEPGMEEPDSPEMLALAFGTDPNADPDEPDNVVDALYLHLASARRLTCPGERRATPVRRTKKRGKG